VCKTLLAQQILVALRKSSLDAASLAEQVKADVSYVHEHLDKMIEADIVVPERKAYRANYLLLMKEDLQALDERYDSKADEIAEVLQQHLGDLQKVIKQLRPFQQGVEEARLRWAVIVTMVLNFGVRRALSDRGLLKRELPVRPDGGRWHFMPRALDGGLQVEGSLLMQSGAKFVEVDLISAEIGSNLGMDGSAFAGKVNMDSPEVEGNLFMRSVTAFTKPLTLIFARIGGTLDLSASTFSSLDLTGTVIQGELRLGSGQHAPTQWQRGSEESNGKPILILRNTQVGALQDLPDAWPDRLELDGFTYDRLGGFARGGPSDIASRDLSWFLTWLQKQENHSPQPYQQLADIMRKAGQEDRANKTLRAGQERGREEAEGIRWLWLTLLKWVIGYGYGYGNFYSLLWVAVFVVIGSLVLKFNTTARVRGIWWRTFYSFDMILPLIRLDERNYKIALEGFARFYFYIHITIGYLLATFFVAGISGLTK